MSEKNRVFVLAPAVLALAVAGVALLLYSPVSAAPGPEGPRHATARVTPPMPILFEANQGQSDASVRYVARRGSHTVFLTDEGLAVAVGGDQGRSLVRMRLAGASTQQPVIEPLEPQPTRVHYYLGAVPEKWTPAVPTYSRIRYHEVYPGIDLDFYAKGERLEYDFIVAPGADLSSIEIEFEGAEGAALTAEGALTLRASTGEVRHHPPFVYQVSADGAKREVAGRFERSGEAGFRFAVDDYNPLLALVIDPELSFASFLGGSLTDWINGVEYASNGNLVAVGQTASTDFPNPLGQSTPAGANGFVAEFARGSRMPGRVSYSLAEVWILGGSGTDTAVGIKIGPGDEYYVGGNTTSTDFPMTSLPPGNHSWVAYLGSPSTSALSLDGVSPDNHVVLIEAVEIPNSGFGGFTGPPYAGANHSPHDHNNDGSHDICFHGQANPSGQPPFDTVTILDGTTLNRISEWHVLRQSGTESAHISRSIFDPRTNEICITGSATGNLFGASHPGSTGTWKQFIGIIPLDTLPPSSPVPVTDIFFVDDGTPANTHVFPEGLQKLPPGSNGPAMIFSGGTWQPQSGPVESFVWSAPHEAGSPLVVQANTVERRKAGGEKGQIVVDPDTGFIRTIPNSNILDLQIGNTLNLNAAGHILTGNESRDLAIWQIDSRTGEVFDELIIAGGNAFHFAADGALWPDGSHYTLVGGAGGNLETTPGAGQGTYPGGQVSGYIAQSESFDLNPLAIVTGGKFTRGPLVPYGFFTIFIDWQRIPGLVVPGLENDRFLKSAAGLEVLVNGEPTATTAATGGQVNFIAHGNVNDNDTATVQLRYTDPTSSDIFVSNLVQMQTAPSWPNPFEINGVGAAIHSQGVLSAENPLRQNDGLTLFFAGGGAFGEDSIEADQLTPVEIFYFDNVPTVEAIVGESVFNVQVDFAGPSPGSTPALGQLNLTFSEDLWSVGCAETDFDFVLRITAAAGTVTYYDHLGNIAEPSLDTRAFATCP